MGDLIVLSADTDLIADLANAVPGALFRIESSDYGAWSFSFLSSGVEAIYGFSPDEVFEDPMVLRRCMLEEDLPGYDRANVVAFESLSVLDYEYRVTTRSGEFRWVGVRAVPRRIDDSAFTWSGIMLDITERQMTEEALVTSETRFRAVFEAVPEGIVLRDRLGKVRDANPAALQILHTSSTELMNTPAMHPLFDAIGTDGLPMSADEHPGLAALQNGQRAEGKILGFSLGADQERRVWIRVNATPIIKNKQIDWAVVTMEDVTETVELTSQMQREAETDFLTRLPNRRSFMARLSAEVERQRLNPDRFSAVLAIDLDHFKVINDTFGHAGGDAVLIHVAEVIADSLRATDAVARAGGEEFLVLLAETTPDGAVVIAERLRARFEQSVVPYDGAEIKITASIGLSRIDHADMEDSEVLVRADGALYGAKAAGRNTVKADWL